MSTQQTDALQCAADLEYSIARHGMQDAFTLNAYRAMKMVRTQQARIADLEAQLEAIGAGGVSGPLIGQPQAMPDLSQLTERGAKAWAGVDAQGLREGFTAADMATASAQGFRDGAASVSAGPDDIDAIALTRYKVVHSHDSMFHRFAVVAGDGKQQLYLGRETECQNMTRKFAGAFLDGAFYQSQIAAAPTPADQAADSVQEDAAQRKSHAD